MEPSGRNQRQPRANGTAREGSDKTVAVVCDRLPRKRDGEEEVALNRLSAKHAAPPISLPSGAGVVYEGKIS
jgi:hypothetical protein